MLSLVARVRTEEANAVGDRLSIFRIGSLTTHIRCEPGAVAIGEQFIDAVDSYIRWYNAKRINISLGSLSLSNTERVLGLRHRTGPSKRPHPH